MTTIFDIKSEFTKSFAQSKTQKYSLSISWSQEKEKKNNKKRKFSNFNFFPCVPVAIIGNIIDIWRKRCSRICKTWTKIFRRVTKMLCQKKYSLKKYNSWIYFCVIIQGRTVVLSFFLLIKKNCWRYLCELARA